MQFNAFQALSPVWNERAMRGATELLAHTNKTS